MAWVISISASVLLDSVFIISTRDMLTEGRDGCIKEKCKREKTNV